MFKLMLFGAGLLAAGGASAAVQGSPAGEAAKGAASCDAKYYGYLVGKGVDEARSIEGSNYRMLSAGTDRGEANPKRMTVVFDAKSNRIVEVGCG